LPKKIHKLDYHGKPTFFYPLAEWLIA